jgi:Fur family zinc uptake transcriptional regulator
MNNMASVLHAHGYKVTRPRQQVFDVLEGTEKPFSPYEIRSFLQEEAVFLNHVTIYRILDLFCRLNLVHRVPSNGGFVKCTLPGQEGCHRFVICRCCGSVQEFADKELCLKEKSFALDCGFHAEIHLSETLGLCAKCYGRSDEKTTI